MSSEAAVSYAALILADAEVEISAEKLLALTKAANIEVQPVSWWKFFAFVKQCRIVELETRRIPTTPTPQRPRNHLSEHLGINRRFKFCILVETANLCYLSDCWQKKEKATIYGTF